MTKLIAIFVSVLTITFFSFYGTKSVSIDTANTNNNKIIKQHTAEVEPPPVSEEGNMSAEAFIKARKQARAMKAKAKQEPKTMMSKKAKNTSGTPQWKMRGPYTYGRVTAIVADPQNPDKVYVGTPFGGVWKSTDGGAHYEPIFDNAGSPSIGSLALDPHDSDIIYAGTGEYDLPKRYNIGDGLWRSKDGGKTWKHLGLEFSYRIGSIVVNPDNSDEIFVAIPKAPRDGAGVYRSRDNGKTWKKILADSLDSHPRIIQMDPSNSSRLYVAKRSTWSNSYNGIYKSEDGGDTWKKLTGGLPERGSEVIYSLAPSSPNRLYAAYPNGSSMSYPAYPNGVNGYELYRSDDYGETWKIISITVHGHLNPLSLHTHYKVYCGKLKVSPDDKNKVYIFSQALFKSTDGGKNFGRATPPGTDVQLHSDHHAMWFSPDGETIYEGNDGGIYKSTNSGTTYNFQSLPIGQFYAIEVDPINHNKILGGMQDNGSGYFTNSNDNWHPINGGDGFTVLVDDTNTSYIYSESQHGAIRVQYGDTWGHDIGKFKIPNGPWHTKMLLDPSNNKIAYYGGDYLYTTTRTGNTLSPLTKVSEKKFSSIYAIDVPLSGHGNTIYVSADRIWLSRNKGKTWELRNPKNTTLINSIATDPKNDAITYISSSWTNRILKTTDYGKTWVSIKNNLPNAPFYDILVDPDYSDTLYCASMFNAYVSFNGGKVWEPLGQNLPETIIKDLKIIKEGSEIILYAGTYGRGIYSIRLTDAQRGGSGQPKTPTAPSNLNATNITTNSAILTWSDNATDETGYKIYNGTTPIIKTVGKDVKTLALTGLKENTSYTYSVKAYNSAGESAASTYIFKTKISNQNSSNLVTNPSFETLTNSKAIDWDAYDRINGRITFDSTRTIDSTQKHTGKYSAKITNKSRRDSGWFGQSISIDNKKTLTFSGWSKASNVSSGALYALDFKVTFADGTHDWYYYDTKFKTGTHDWQKKEITKTFAKPVVGVTPIILLHRGTGTVWFDDVSVTVK